MVLVPSEGKRPNYYTYQGIDRVETSGSVGLGSDLVFYPSNVLTIRFHVSPYPSFPTNHSHTKTAFSSPETPSVPGFKMVSDHTLQNPCVKESKKK